MNGRVIKYSLLSTNTYTGPQTVNLDAEFLREAFLIVVVDGLSVGHGGLTVSFRERSHGDSTRFVELTNTTINATGEYALASPLGYAQDIQAVFTQGAGEDFTGFVELWGTDVI